MIRILFVDDEQNVLEGLQRMLRPMRNAWQMQFRASASDALDELSGNTYDVIVSDMRMPGMNGAQLLAHVRDRYPKMTRLALSGHTDREFILQAVGSTHQFLAKPCDPVVLKETITSVCALRELVANIALRERISRTQAVPTLAPVFQQLVEELASESASAARVGQIIASDIGLSAKTLQLVNSSFFGTPRQVCDPAEAVAMIGLETLREIVHTGGIFTVIADDHAIESDIDIWTVSALTAKIAGDIAEFEQCHRPIVDAARTSGLLHRIGALLIADMEGYVPNRNTESATAAYLLSLWGFSQSVVEAVGWSHRPSSSPYPWGAPLAIVHVANILAREIAGSENAGKYEIDHHFLETVGFAGRLSAWRRIANEAIMSGVFK